MFKKIERPADREIRSVIRFLNARNVRPVDIHRHISEIYGENAMSDGMVRKWVHKFNEGRENVHDDNSMRKVDENFVRTNGSALSLHFPRISRPALYENCVRVGCPKCSQRSTKTQFCKCFDIFDTLSRGGR
ncbi:hypothetical protein L798_02648 [Zootermopsis nevadensis]|uniref:Mos1 transposase HTH domain-containing protein n=1 Tax=Zootermopsis nevadensis TaxID=136037 RepID=A0A067QH72_ZOONE|nr:hypothetical protein L798_02648 [Zootermopsis nevadensis]